MYIVCYLKGSATQGLFFPATSSTMKLEAFSDADWDTWPDSRRSITGFCIFWGGSLISWKAKRQSTVSRSSAEAEYRSMASIVVELKWTSYLLCDLQIPVIYPVDLWCDNQASIDISANLVFTKHLDIDCHYVKDQVKLGFVQPQYVCYAS